MLPPMPPGAVAPGPPPGPMPPMMGAPGGGLPLMPPPVPAAMAGQAAAALVPGQMAQQQQVQQAQTQEVIAALMSVFQSAPNPAAEGIGGMPAPMLTDGPPSGSDPNSPDAGY